MASSPHVFLLLCARSTARPGVIFGGPIRAAVSRRARRIKLYQLGHLVGRVYYSSPSTHFARVSRLTSTTQACQGHDVTPQMTIEGRLVKIVIHDDDLVITRNEKKPTRTRWRRSRSQCARPVAQIIFQNCSELLVELSNMTNFPELVAGF